MPAFLLATAIWVTSIGVAAGQDRTLPEADRRQVVPFLEGTDVFITAPRGDLIFEADIQPNLVVSQNFSDKLIVDESLTGQWRIAYSIVGTPRVRLRMFDERSAPVRTPSYMPKGSASVMFFRGERTAPRHRVGIWAAQLTVGHHSNGQDGCLFEADVLVDDDCIGSPDLSRINRKDGSFSTNFVRIGGRYRREWLSTINAGQPTEEHLGTSQLTFGVDVDLHFNTDERVAPLYGEHRARGYAEVARRFSRVCRNRAAASVAASFVGTEPETVPPIAYQVDGVCTFTPHGGWGAFVRYYDGQDYYNLAFAQHIRRVQFGVRYEQDGFLRFITRAAKDVIEQREQQREQAR